MKGRIGVSLLTAAILVASVTPAPAQRTSRTAAGAVLILEATGSWRLHHSLKPPLIRTSKGLEPILQKQSWLNRETPEPPADWTAVEFDDSRWFRGPAGRACRTPQLARLCLRGRFTVTDPAKVKGLSVTLSYHGGAIIFVNGQEVGRGHMPAGSGRKSPLARDYPAEVFVNEKGGYLATAGAYLNGRPSGRPSAASQRRLAKRERKLEKVAIPRKFLRRGVNVLAVEIVRAPWHKAIKKLKGGPKTSFPYELTWNTCDLHELRLTAAGAGGLVPDAVRPKGLQLWNSDPLAGDFDLDAGNRSERLQPILLVGARNGTFSGKVVVGSDTAIQGLRVRCGDLKGEGATIPASAIGIRYAVPWGKEIIQNQTYHRQPYPYAAGVSVLDMLVESPPREVPVRTKGNYGRNMPWLPKPVFGAVVPVWVTVAVPKNARAGTYSGLLTISAKGHKAVKASVTLKVADWTLPDTQDYRTWVEAMQSPDTLAVEYGARPWSADHWSLIAKSFDFLKQIGSRVVYVPLLAHTNLGNDESMVRWIEKGTRGRRKVEYDFSVMDRYLDLADKHMGKPKIVVFNVWDLYLIPKEGGMASGDSGGHRRMVRYMDSHNGVRGWGPLVTVLDPRTGKTENANLPPYSDSSARGLWRPLFKQLRSRMKKRGLEKAMMLGMITDARPSKQEVQLFNEIAPGLPWVSHGHGGFGPKQKLHGIGTVGYQACVWYTKFANEVHTHGRTWGPERLLGWKQSQLTVAFERNPGLDSYPLTRWRHMAESNISGGQRGVGRLGADYWAIGKDKRGRRRGTVYDRFPESLWMNLNVRNSLLAPGREGPLATTRYEAFREGVQECEARIFIERALADKRLKARLGAKLAKRCEKMLVLRTAWMWQSLSSLTMTGPGWSNGLGWRWSPGVAGHTWFVGSNWQQRTGQLYALAGQVAGKLNK